MKKIICYGIKNCELRRKVGLFLSKEFEIIGYSDSYATEDNLQGEHFISPFEISQYEYDYVLVLSVDGIKQQEIKQALAQEGVRPESIIIPRLLYNGEAYFTPDLKKEIFEKARNEYYGVILGLSYSLRGIDTRKLKKSFIDFSWHGLDIYYNWISLKFFLDNYNGNIQKAFLVFPYYYFNYDMSSSFYQFNTAQILALHAYEDWHNANNSFDDRIRDYLKCFELFGEKFWEQVNWKKYCPKNTKVIDNKFSDLNEIWKKEYIKTQKENYEIMQNILNMLSQKKTKIYIIIPPILKSYINKSEWLYYESTRNYFYYLMNELNSKYVFEVLDYSELFNLQPQFFYDYEHLNEVGRQEFTKTLNDLLK